MNRYKSDASVNISSQLSRFILNKARDLYLSRLKNEAIHQRSLEINKLYPAECTQTIMQLCNFSPNHQAEALLEELESIPLSDCRDYHPPLKSMKSTPRLSSRAHRSEKVSHIRAASKRQRADEVSKGIAIPVAPDRFVPLASRDENDCEIEALRLRKQKLFTLDKYFDESEKKEKSKFKQRVTETISHSNFTTDFNGEKIEMRPTQFKKNDPYLMVEMEASISEVKSFNRLNTREEKHLGTSKQSSRQCEVQLIAKEDPSKSKTEKLSHNFQAFTLKQIQNFMNKESRRKKQQSLNRLSRLKMPQMMSINFIKCSSETTFLFNTPFVRKQHKQISSFPTSSLQSAKERTALWLQINKGQCNDQKFLVTVGFQLQQMGKFNFLSKLPQYYSTHPTLSTIAGFIAKSSVRFSGLFINRNNENYLLLKDGFIHIREDWEAYNLLRATSKLIITSGQILRNEPEVFKSREAYGNQNIQDLNDAILERNKQKLFFFTRTYTPEQLRASINEEVYQLLELPKYETVYNAMDLMRKESNLPMTVQVGLDLFHQYFEEVDKGRENFVDTLLISKYTGEAEEKYIGPKFTVPMEKDYKMSWKSEAYPCELSNGQKGNLNLQIFTLK